MKVEVVEAGTGVGTGSATGWAGLCFAAALGSGGVPPRGAPAIADPFAFVPPLEVMVVAADGEKLAALNSEELKNSRQVASTEFGSAMYFSYISSTSQSLAPKFPLTEGNPIGAH